MIKPKPFIDDSNVFCLLKDPQCFPARMVDSIELLTLMLTGNFVHSFVGEDSYLGHGYGE
jgi:hypothetical protein